MKCPRCGHEHKELINDKWVPKLTTVCIMCNFPVVNSEKKEFVEYCAGTIKQHIDNFESTKNKKYLIYADLYLKVAILEVEKDEDIDLPVRFEGSI